VLISFNAVLRALLTPIRRVLGRPKTTSTSVAHPTPSTQPEAVTEAPPREKVVRASRGGKYDARLVRIVAGQPGITVAEAAEMLGLPASGLYPTIRRLQSTGQLVKQGRGLYPAG